MSWNPGLLETTVPGIVLKTWYTSLTRTSGDCRWVDYSIAWDSRWFYGPIQMMVFLCLIESISANACIDWISEWCLQTLNQCMWLLRLVFLRDWWIDLLMLLVLNILQPLWGIRFLSFGHWYRCFIDGSKIPVMIFPCSIDMDKWLRLCEANWACSPTMPLQVFTLAQADRPACLYRADQVRLPSEWAGWLSRNLYCARFFADCVSAFEWSYSGDCLKVWLLIKWS